MSWPMDGLPRYKAASDSKGDCRRGEDWRPIGYVFDRGYCHRAVLAIRDKREAVALATAESAADVLNAGGELTPELRGELPHGWRRYRYERCRCDTCKRGWRDYNLEHRTRRRARA